MLTADYCIRSEYSDDEVRIAFALGNITREEAERFFHLGRIADLRARRRELEEMRLEAERKAARCNYQDDPEHMALTAELSQSIGQISREINELEN